MTRLSEKQARALGVDLGPKKNKYRARKVEVDGIIFDSRKEANKYCELKMLQRAGEVEEFELQPEYILQPGFRDKNGKYHRPIKYRADFWVRYANGLQEVIDVKGYKTDVYRLKLKLLLWQYPDIRFREE